MTTAARARAGRDGRRAAVEEALRDLRWPAVRRAAPPEGKLGAADYPLARLRTALTALGPVFADFGRYLSSRPDLLPRRHCVELALIGDTRSPTEPHVLAAHLRSELGGPASRLFVEFETVPDSVTLWTERHRAHVAPDLPVVLTIVRPDAAEWIARDVPLLPLLADCLSLDHETLAAAIDDYTHTLRARLDQTIQAAALATLANDASSVAGFHAPAWYRDLSTTAVLTTDDPEGTNLAVLLEPGVPPEGDRADLARRLTTVWLRQALAGRVVPFDFTAHDIVIADERIVLLSGACEPHSSRQRPRFSRYMNAVAADDPDSAASWILDAPDAEEILAAREEELKRRFRQAVPFRDVEWSGDERLAEYVLVQWRAACESGLHLSPYHVHMYRGLATIAAMTDRLAPGQDSMLVALQDARLLLGASDAAQSLTPAAITTRLENALREMITLPQKLDDILTLAAEGRLRVRLQVPSNGERRRVKRQTVQLVAALVLLVAIASLVRHAAPAYGPIVERVGSLVLLAVGGWLLVAAARL